MYRPFIALLLCVNAGSGFAQTTYFQQEVHYTIQAALNDGTHALDAHIRMEYVNHAPDTLKEIWMHLWANAYQNRRTAFSRQKLRDGSSRFYFAPDKDLGFFKNINFTVDGTPSEWRYDTQNPDIAVLKLAKPLAPGAKIVIETPFYLQIPASFSRLGHVETSYQMTQWYPKPAVYDNRGWHAMPYLDVGEFYSEFGSFDVSITLPDNYVVGATGVLQTPSEWAFLQKREAETRQKLENQTGPPPGNKKNSRALDSFPASSPVLKTLRFTADSVHDFAWFADKRFFVLKDTARLGSGRQVDCWAMFTAEDFDLWKKGAFYVRRAVEFYSRCVGEYPWPHATAVHSALSAGGGMEYPMITVIGDESSGKALDDVITHEVGHNWFYGILASNERDHPWMDEGINSYYEDRYMAQYYGSSSMNDMLPRWVFDPAKSGSIRENACLMLAREGADTPPDTHSNDFWFIAYGIQVYMKTALCLEWLERSLGKDRFDRAMQAYYQRWKFRHPYPGDLRQSWQDSGIEPGWFFQTMQTRKRFDMALTRIKTGADSVRLTVKNRGNLAAPFNLTALHNGHPVLTQWYPAPAQRVERLSFPTVDADQFVLDYEHATLDVNRQNNSRRTSGMFPGIEPLSLRLLTPAQNPARSTLGMFPWLAWNNYDKTLLGLLLYNSPFPPRRFQYVLMPGFGLGSGQFSGLADFRYKFLPGGFFPKITAGFSAKTFNYSHNPTERYYLRYFRLAPQLRAELRSASPDVAQSVLFRTLYIGQEEAQYDAEGYQGKNRLHTLIYEGRYELARHGLPNPFQLALALEWQNYRAADAQTARYLRSSAEWKQEFYFKPKRRVSARIFAGYFPVNTQRHRGNVSTNSFSKDIARGSFALSPQGFNDYRYDQMFLARTDSTGLFARQLSQTEGGFKNAYGPAFAGVLGNSNNFILAVNLKADLPQRLPFGIPLKPYFDAGYFDDATPLGANRPFKEQFLWSGGLMLEFFKGGLEIYFPLINAKPLNDRYAELAKGNYLRRISWSIRLGKVTPLDIVRQLTN